jgi:ankyrin repeat protein
MNIYHNADIFMAAAHNNFQQVEHLLRQGYSINARDSTGGTLLHAGVRYRNSPLILIAMRNGVNALVRNNQGETALHLVAQTHNTILAGHLFDYQAQGSIVDLRGRTALHIACMYGSDGPALQLIRGGMDTSIADAYGQTALHHACKFHRFNVIRVLVNSGVELRTRDHDGNTVMHHLLERETDDTETSHIVALLCLKGAQPNLCVLNHNGCKPIDFVQLETPLWYQLRHLENRYQGLYGINSNEFEDDLDHPPTRETLNTTGNEFDFYGQAEDSSDHRAISIHPEPSDNQVGFRAPLTDFRGLNLVPVNHHELHDESDESVHDESVNHDEVNDEYDDPGHLERSDYLRNFPEPSLGIGGVPPLPTGLTSLPPSPTSITGPNPYWDYYYDTDDHPVHDGEVDDGYIEPGDVEMSPTAFLNDLWP